MRILLAILFEVLALPVAGAPPPPTRPNQFTTNSPGTAVLGPAVFTNSAAGGIAIDTPGGGLIRWLDLVNGAVNIVAYGADSTGVTNCDSAFATAIAAVSSTTNGGTIYLPRGVYRISHPITSIANVELTIRGESTVNGANGLSGSIIRLAPSANTDMLVKPVGTRVNLVGLTFDGNLVAQTSTNLHGIWLKGTPSTIDKSTLIDIIIQNVSGVGIQNDNRESRFYRVNAQGCVSDNIQNTASSDTEWEDILSGFGGNCGMNWIGVNSSRIVRADIYRNFRGFQMTNCNNNVFVGVQCDANMAEGLLLSSGGGQLSLHNNFHGCNFLVNNFPFDNTLATGPSPIANGTYSNVRILGDNTAANDWIACQFYGYENTLTNRPKYLVEDARNFYVTNAIQYTALGFKACYFTASTNSVLGPYQTNMIHNAALDSWLDGGRIFTDISYLTQLAVNRINVSDQLLANDWQYNAQFTNGGWQTITANLPSFFLQPAYNVSATNAYTAFFGAPTNAAGAAINWGNPIWLSSTNGTFETPGNLQADANATIAGALFASNITATIGQWQLDKVVLDTAGGNLTTNQTGTTFINYGEGSAVIRNLPAPVAGLRYTFINNNTNGQVVNVTGGATIRAGSAVSTVNGFFNTTTIGDAMTLVALNSTNWYALYLTGAGWGAH